jgi:hypothetical protein
MDHRIEIPDDLGGGWVEIRAKRSWADVKRIDQQAIKLEGVEGGSGSFIGKMDLLEQGIAKLESAVVRWSVTDENGGPIPPDRGGFVHPDFDPEFGDWLIEQIDAYYAGRTRSKRGAAAVAAGAAAGPA